MFEYLLYLFLKQIILKKVNFCLISGILDVAQDRLPFKKKLCKTFPSYNLKVFLNAYECIRFNFLSKGFNLGN